MNATLTTTLLHTAGGVARRFHWRSITRSTIFSMQEVALLLVVLITVGAISATAQEMKQPRKVGVLLAWEEPKPDTWLQAFKDGMTAQGWVEHKNIQYFVEYGRNDGARMSLLAKKLVALKVDAIFGSAGATLAALRKATSTIPIVSADMWDPIAEGASTSLAKPSANITGLSWQSVESATKRLEIAKEIVPGLRSLGVLFDASDPGPLIEVNGLVANAKKMRIKTVTFEVRNAKDFAATYTAIRREKPDALVVSSNPLTFSKIAELSQFAISLSRPLISEQFEFADGGALIAYGIVGIETYKRAAVHVDKILKGAKPSELPIEQPTLFELVVNLKTAKALGIKIPESIMVRATRVIR